MLEGVVKITGRIKELYKLDNGKYVVPGHIENALILGPLINQAIVEGKDRPYNIALIVPNFEAIGYELKIDKAGEDIMETHGDQIIDMLTAAVVESMKDPKLKTFERIRNFVIVPEFTGNFVTPKQSLKRHLILKHYADDIDNIYKEDPRL